MIKFTDSSYEEALIKIQDTARSKFKNMPPVMQSAMAEFATEMFELGLEVLEISDYN
jgi:hypothetical protein